MLLKTAVSVFPWVTGRWHGPACPWNLVTAVCQPAIKQKIISYLFNCVHVRGWREKKDNLYNTNRTLRPCQIPILGILYKTLMPCLKRTKVWYLCHNKTFSYTNKMGKTRSYSKHTVMVECIHILPAMLPCTGYSDTSYKHKKKSICKLCSDIFTSSRTSILQLSIIATFLSIRSKIRPGVAIITWTEREIWAKLL